jgi:hypothetical protein
VLIRLFGYLKKGDPNPTSAYSPVSVQSVSTGILDEVEKVSGEGLYLTVLP